MFVVCDNQSRGPGTDQCKATPIAPHFCGWGQLNIMCRFEDLCAVVEGIKEKGKHLSSRSFEEKPPNFSGLSH